MPDFLSSASNTTVYAGALGLVAVGLVILLVGLRLRPEPTSAAEEKAAPKKPTPKPAPAPKGYGIVKTGKEPAPDPNTIIVGAPAEWGGAGPVAVELDGAEKRAAAEASKPGPMGPVMRAVGTVVLVLGLLVSVVAVQRVLEKPPTDVSVELPSVLLSQPKTSESLTRVDTGLLDRAGRAYDQRAAGSYGQAGLRVLAERVTVKDPRKALGSFDDALRGPTELPPGPLGGLLHCYARTGSGTTCVAINRSSVVIVIDPAKRSLVSAAARTRAIRGKVVQKS